MPLCAYSLGRGNWFVLVFSLSILLRIEVDWKTLSSVNPRCDIFQAWRCSDAVLQKMTAWYEQYQSAAWSFFYIRMWPHLSRSLQSLSEMKITLNYRRIFFMLIGLGILLYAVPVLFRKMRSSRPAHFVPFDCLQERIEEYKEPIHDFDASLHYDEVESNYFPFTGNGYFALGVSHLSSKLLIRQGKNFGPISYSPLASISVGKETQWSNHDTAATVMDFRSGIVHLLQSFGETSTGCLQV